jgi:uncharacterized membrane protein
MSFDLSKYTDPDPHLSSGERLVSVLAGLALTSIAAQPRSNVFLSMLALASGSYLAYRGATGFCIVKASLDDRYPKQVSAASA